MKRSGDRGFKSDWGCQNVLGDVVLITMCVDWSIIALDRGEVVGIDGWYIIDGNWD